MRQCYEYWPGPHLSLSAGLTVRPDMSRLMPKGPVENTNPEPSKVNSRASVKSLSEACQRSPIVVLWLSMNKGSGPFSPFG